ncbi:MAG: hypothetical protein E7212_01860 [Clostridium sartagoforme]|nr:hypothetical protein [Clostridium sartagoforme]
MTKVSLFFGAGAECSYGLPSGGKFALDIFRMNTSDDKVNLKEQLCNVDKQSNYARWLPEGFDTKKLTAFTKTQYESIVKGSLENKRNNILDYLSNFDEKVNLISQMLHDNGIDIEKVFLDITGLELGSYNYSHIIRLNPLLGGNISLFGSNYFSAFLKLLEIENVSYDFKLNIRNITRAIIELLIGSLGEDLIHRLNDGIFYESPESIDLFDDLGAIFTLDYTNTGMKGLELLIENQDLDIKEDYNNEDKITKFGLQILEDIYSRALDYQTLIDSNWRYIYSPKTDWGKFNKIVIFLYTVKRYIESIAKNNTEKIKEGNGYYHDVLYLKEFVDINAIGTTNYNSFIEDITKEEVYYLNGSINDYYDPYLNKIISFEENIEKNHIIVPFLFTQSGIKPLTSVKMSKRYVDMFNKFKDSDIICVCGFAFNCDDGHINGLFRELIEDYNKTICILHYVDESHFNIRTVINEYKEKLRLDNTSNLRIIVVDKNRNKIGSGDKWFEVLVNK